MAGDALAAGVSGRPVEAERVAEIVHGAAVCLGCHVRVGVGSDLDAGMPEHLADGLTSSNLTVGKKGVSKNGKSAYRNFHVNH